MSKQAPQLVPETFVLELAQNNADIIHDGRNGDYTVTFAEPLHINTGDSLAMRMASIDSQKSDSQSIVFADDQHININFSYYDVNYPIQDASFANLLTRRPLDTPAGTYPVDFKFHTTYTVAGDVQLDSIEVSYQGAAPFYPDKYDGNIPLGTKTTASYQYECYLIMYYCCPLLSWVDTDGVSRQSVAAPFTLFSKSGGEGVSEIACQAKNQTDENWKYTYGSFTTIDQTKNPNYTLWQVPLVNATPGQKLLGVPIGSEKIVARDGTLRVTGVTAGYIVEYDNVALGIISKDQHNTVTSAFGVGAKNTTALPSPESAYQLVRRNASTIIPAGRYDRQTLANLMTRNFTQVGVGNIINSAGTSQSFTPDSDLVFDSGAATSEDFVFHRLPDPSIGTEDLQLDFSSTNTYSYINSGKSVQCGARKFAIEYGDIGQTFQVSDAHQSVENPADKGKENVAFFRTGVGSVANPYIFNQVDTATGIIVHDLSPREIWDDVMGLYNKWVVPIHTDPSGVEYYTKADIIDKFPRESAEIVTFDPTNSRVDLTPSLEATFVDTTTTPTYAVIGDSPQVNVEGAYYLVEITGLNVAQSNLIDNLQNRANISAIVSKQYDANDIITGFSDSAIPYTHRGVPTIINSARVRILDPDTKEVVSTLGDRNTVFLQLNSAAPVYQPTQSLPPKVEAPKTQTK
jgi:hypothetical protein